MGLWTQTNGDCKTRKPNPFLPFAKYDVHQQLLPFLQAKLFIVQTTWDA
jgi:hypothetical protein